MGANSKFHKIIGAAEIVVGAILDYFDYGTFGNGLILAGLATWEGVPGNPTPAPSAINTTLSSPITPLQIPYGCTKFSGLLIASDSNSSNPDIKVMAVALGLSLKNGSSAIQIEGPPNTGYFYIDDNPINTGFVDWSGTGAIVGSGGVGNQIDYDGIISIKVHLGAQTVADSILTGNLSYWTSTAVGKGIVYLVAQINADPTNDAVNAAFPSGLPRNLAVVLNGSRVYDPRLDGTAGGSGSQRKNDPTTWTYSANPALCLRDYLVRPISEGGGGINYAVIPDDYLSAAANVCDSSLTVPNNLGGTTTTSRYICGVGLVTSDGVPANCQKLLDAMAGWIVQTGGELRIFAGSYVAPVTTINEDWLCGGPSFQTTGEQDTRYNSVNATFTDQDSAYQVVQTPTFSPTGAIAADGGIPLTKNLNLVAVPAQYNAQLITMISGKQSREMGQLTLPCNLLGMDVDTGENVEIDIAEYGLTNYVVRIKNWQRKGDSSILLTAQQANSGTFTETTFTEVDPLGQPPLVQHPPHTPTNMVVQGHVGGVSLDWDEQAPWAVTNYEVWRSTSSGGTYTKVKITPDTKWDDTIPTTTTYWYKVRAKNYAGQYSGFTSPLSGTARNVTDVVGGTGPNLMPAKYSLSTTPTLPVFGLSTSLTISRASSTAYQGYKTFVLTSNNSSVAPKLALVASTATPKMQLSTKRYGVQVWLNSTDAAFYSLTARFYNGSGVGQCTAVALSRVGGGSGSGVYYAFLDMTAATDTLVYLEFEWLGTITSSHFCNMQAVAVFEMAGTSTVVQDFSPNPVASLDDANQGETNFTASELGADVTVNHTNGAGSNLCRLIYSLFNVNSLQPGFGTNHITTSASATVIYGFAALQLAFDGVATGYLRLRQSSNETTLHLRKKKYVVSVYVDNGTSNNNAYAFHFEFMNGGGVPTTIAASSTVTATSDHAANTAGVYTGVIDLTGASTLDVFLALVWDSNPSAGNGLIQGVQVEEMVGTYTAPSVYEAPTDWGVNDPSGATQIPTGSTPAIIPDMNFGYTRNTTSILISWSSFSIRRPDSSTTSVASGSQNVTGLSSGTTYGYYPFWDEINLDVEFCQRSAGSPAIFSTIVSSGIIASAQTRLGRIPLSIGACSVATTSSGTGGGSGGGTTNCLHPRQPLMVRRSGEITMIPACEAREGDELYTGREWSKVVRAWTEPHEEFTEVTFHNGERICVTPHEPVYHPDGSFTKAKALRLDDIIDGMQHPLEVRQVRKVVEKTMKVCVEMESDDHLFYVTPNGPKLHNTVYKP